MLNSTPTVTTNSNVETPSDFAEKIQESKDAIAQAAQAPVTGQRGRRRLPRDANGKIIRPENGASPAHVGGPTANNGDRGASNTHSVATSSPIDAKVLIEPFKIISKIPARKYGVKEIALDTDEATMLAEATDKLITAYLPDLEKMSPKAAAWLTFGLTASSLFLSKAMIYSETMQSRYPENDGDIIAQENPNEVKAAEATINSRNILKQNSFSVQREHSL